MTAKRPWRRLLAAAAALAIAAPSTLLVPAAALAAGPAAPNVTASGPNVFQKTPNGPIYFKPTTGRTSGTYLRTYGLAPTSEYRRPSDVVALGSYVYVLDAGNYRIVKRKASDLSFVKVSASIAARVSEPKRMASDGTYLYITDYDGGRIVVYRVSTLAYVGSFGSSGSGTGHFSHPIGIAAAGGHVYVADTVNSRLVKLSTWPIKWQKAYGSAGSGTGHFTFPQGLAVIGSYLYVADTGNARIVRLSTALSATGWKAVTSVGSPAAPLNGIDELATDGTSLYAHVQSGPALVKLTSSLGFVKRLVSPSGASHWGDLIGLGASKAGLFLTHIAVDKGSASYNNQISRHSLTSLAVAKVSGDKHPYSANQWDMPYSATSDGTNLYVGDIGRILVCPLAGTTCTRTIGLPEGYEAYAMTTFGGDLYVVDYLGNRMFVVNIDTGTISFQLGTLGSGDDQLNGPSGIVYMASLGQIFILDSGNNRVVARNAATLAFVAKAGTHGSSPGQLGYPMGMAGDQGFLYIADTGNNRVAKWFAASLTEAAASPGGFGTGSGQFDSPTGIATDGDSVWVSDIGNQRVQRLSVLNLGYLSQQKSSSTMPFPGGGVSGLASIGGKLLLIDVRRGRAYLEYGGGPLAVTVAPSDATVPWVTGFDWVGAAPAGWTSPANVGYLLAPTATRYLGWSSTAVGGSFTAQIDSILEAGTPRTLQLIADTVGPKASAAPFAKPANIASTSATSAKADIMWALQDAGAGVATTELSRSVNGGAWTTVSKQSASGGPATQVFAYPTTLKPGTTYRFRVRGTDTVGNTGAWKTAASFTVATIAENGSGVTASSGWSRVADAGAIGGYVRVTSAAGKTLTYKGTLSYVAVYGRRVVGGGSFKVYLDGALLGTGSTNNGSFLGRSILALAQASSKGTHTLKLVTNGDGPVAIDGFVPVK